MSWACASARKSYVKTITIKKSELAENVDELEQRIAALEQRIVELERCKHDSHTLSPQVVDQVAELVKQNIVRTLLAFLPADPAPTVSPDSAPDVSPDSAPEEDEQP